MEASWLISLVVIIVAVCAGLAALGFRGRITTVGIDLGTTFSVVGINKQGKIIIIEDKAGHKIFPSIVSYRNNGEIVVGYDALGDLSSRPQNTIYNAKRFIGRSLDEDQVRTYADEHPFKVVPSSLSNFSKVGFEIETDGVRRVVSPEQVGTEVLRFLLKVTADFLGHSQVNKAVVAVPAKFNSEQRQATHKLHKKSNIHHILVYDFGGGTLDVSLLYVAKGSVQVYATDGDETLGGSDFDLCLAKTIKNRVEQMTQVAITNDHTNVLHAASASDVSEDELCSFPSIHTKAEEIKKQLTYSEEVGFNCTLLDKEGGATVVQFSVQRERDFHEGCQHLFERGLLPVHRLLHDLNMRKDDVDEVVLVGGSTRIPLVKQRLRDFFNKELNDHIDPDVTVAYGAASILD